MGLILLWENFLLRARWLVSTLCIKAYFESWVKLLTTPLSTPQTLRNF